MGAILRTIDRILGRLLCMPRTSWNGYPPQCCGDPWWVFDPYYTDQIGRWRRMYCMSCGMTARVRTGRPGK